MTRLMSTLVGRIERSNPATAITVAFIVGCAALLSGCAQDQTPIDASQLVRPDPKLMQHPRAMPDIPRDEATNPAARAAYYAESRNTCGADKARLGGLQSYVRALHGDPNPAQPPKSKPAPRVAATQVARIAP